MKYKTLKNLCIVPATAGIFLFGHGINNLIKFDQYKFMTPEESNLVYEKQLLIQNHILLNSLEKVNESNESYFYSKNLNENLKKLKDSKLVDSVKYYNNKSLEEVDTKLDSLKNSKYSIERMKKMSGNLYGILEVLGGWFFTIFGGVYYFEFNRKEKLAKITNQTH